MQELINIEATPPLIVANFDEVEAQLTEYLRQYDVVVTPDSVGDAKKLRTELRKHINELDTRIKDVLADAGAPIREADDRRKQLVQLGRDVDDKIKEQVTKFENETKKLAERALDEERSRLWDYHGVADEHKSAEFDDLIKLSALTKNRKLTASAANELDQRVSQDRLRQERTERRIADLSRLSYDANLSAPLTRDHVESFIFSSDEHYAANVQRIIDSEVERQYKAEQRMRETVEREAKQKAEAEHQKAELKKRREQTEEGPDKPEQQESTASNMADAGAPVSPRANGSDGQAEKGSAPPKPGGVGKSRWIVTCTFKVNVHNAVSREDICEEARKVMAKAGVTTLTGVEASKE